jgi:hypothetical protein
MCGRKLSQVVNFYTGDARPLASYACSKCFPPDPTLPKGCTVVIQLDKTQVILSPLGFYARCTSPDCTWVSEGTVHARHDAEQAAKSHEDEDHEDFWTPTPADWADDGTDESES